MNNFGTRTYLEVRVGTHHSAEVVLHLMRQHVEWFNQSRDENLRQVLHVLQSVFPRLFFDEIEVSHAKKSREILPPELGPGGVPVDAGEVNVAHKRKKLTKKQELDAQRQLQKASKPAKDFYHAFGKTLKLTYRLHEPKTKPTTTLVVNSGKYKELVKLSQRIEAYCYPYDPQNPYDPDPEGGMPRPEIIPTSELFRRK